MKQAEAVSRQYEWEEVTLHDLRYDAQIRPDASFLVNLSADLRTDSPRKLSLRLVDSAQQNVAQADVPITNDMEILLDIPADLAFGEYTLVAIVYDPESLASFPDLTGNFETPLISLQADAAAE